MSAIKGQEPCISPFGDYEREYCWLLHVKQEENITKRTPQLFSSVPTNTYTWQLEMLVTLAPLGPVTIINFVTIINLLITHMHLSS